MSDLISSVEKVLTQAGYSCWRAELGSLASIGFEDASLLGFAFIFPDAQTILDGWRETEQKMINRHAHVFRRAGDKAWNVYCAFLTQAEGTKAECRSLRVIEEDLEQTRKLTGTGLTDEGAVAQSLLPVLPINSRPQLGTFDADARLAKRLDALVPGISTLLLDEDVEPVQVLQHLRQPK